MAKRKRNSKGSSAIRAVVTASYKHPEATTPLRPEVGTQPQFKNKKPPATYRYDSSLSPALEWDGQSGRVGQSYRPTDCDFEPPPQHRRNPLYADSGHHHNATDCRISAATMRSRILQSVQLIRAMNVCINSWWVDTTDPPYGTHEMIREAPQWQK